MGIKKFVVIGISLALALVIMASAVFLPQIPTFASGKLTPIYRVNRSDNKVALSFDAAWGSDETLKILSILNKYNVKATFFLVAFWAEKYPELVKTIVASGHEIGTHSSTHPHFNSLSYEGKREELLGSIRRISAISETKINSFRPPFGEYNDGLITLCGELGLNAVQWDVDTLDWKGISASEITDRVLKKVKSGSIILMHNDGDHTAEAIDIFIPKLQAMGYELTTVAETLLQGDYYTNSNGEQHSC